MSVCGCVCGGGVDGCILDTQVATQALLDILLSLCGDVTPEIRAVIASREERILSRNPAVSPEKDEFKLYCKKTTCLSV